jgi:hypothetical protein
MSKVDDDWSGIDPTFATPATLECKPLTREDFERMVRELPDMETPPELTSPAWEMLKAAAFYGEE